MGPDASPSYRWLHTGDEAFAAMVEAIDAAGVSVLLETYIYEVGEPGDSIRAALVRAAQRRVEVRVLVDALGSLNTPDSHWDALREAGGRFTWFNSLALDRLSFRDHRKLLVCDGEVALVGGFNVAPEYAGDGVRRGWRDLGMVLRGPVVAALTQAFESMWGRAGQVHPRLPGLRRPWVQREQAVGTATLFQSCPGRGLSPLRKTLLRDLKEAREVRILAAYFLPTPRLRRALEKVARRGGRVQLIVPGPSDVPLSQFATRSLYTGLLRARVEIFEYQPQVLHAKLIIIDDLVFVGSANLDTRSLHINYELLLRFQDAGLAAEAREIFERDLGRSRRVDSKTWKHTRTFWNKLRERWARFILTRIDPLVARHQLRSLR